METDRDVNVARMKGDITRAAADRLPKCQFDAE